MKLEETSLRGGVSRKIAMSIRVAGRLQKGCIQASFVMTQGMVVNPPKALGRRGKAKGLTIWLQPRKELR